MKTAALLILVMSTCMVRGMPATQPSKAAAARAIELKAAVKTFELSLKYTGDKDKPYYQLDLAVTPKPAGGSGAQMQITPEQAAKIIDYLALEGFLDHALDLNRNGSPVPPPQPYYTLCVLAKNDKGVFGYEEWLPWDLRLLLRLEGLAKVLEGNAAESTNLLIGRLNGHRLQWTEEGRVYVHRGLALFVRPTKPAFGARGALAFEFVVKNESKRDFALSHDPTLLGMWNLVILGAQEDQRYGVMPLRIRRREAIPGPVVIKAGQEHAFKLQIAEDEGFIWRGGQAFKNVPVEHLQPGKYTLIASINCDDDRSDPAIKDLPSRWIGHIETAPTPFEIAGVQAMNQQIEDLASADGPKRVAASKAIFEMGKDALEPLQKAGAKQILPEGTIDTRRMDMVYSLIEGLQPTPAGAMSGYTKNSFGIRVEKGCTREYVMRLGEKHGFTLVGDFQADGVPSCYVQLAPGKTLADVLKDILCTEPQIITVNLNYFVR